MKAVSSLYLAQAREFLRDRSAVLFVLLLPVAFGVFFGLVFSQGGSFTLQLGVVNEDQGPAGEGLLENLKESGPQGGYAIATGERGVMLEALEQGDLHILLVLPEGLTASLASGQTVEVPIFYDSANANSSNIGVGMAKTLVDEINLNLSGSPRILEMDLNPVQSHPLRAIDFYMPGMLGVALLWLGVFGTAQPIVAQREAQILRRIGVTPISRLTILASEVGWRVSVGLMQAALFLLVGYFGFGVGVLDWLPFIGAVLLGTLVFVCMGYVLAGIGRSMESTMAIAQMLNFPLMMLSGSIFAAEVLPDFFEPITNALPLTYLSDLLRHAMVGAPVTYSLGMSFALLGGWLVILVLGAIKLWRWE
jgi:ABC-2 type transport system permease protein